MKHESIVQFLKQVYFFQNLDHDDFAYLAKYTHEESFPSGCTVFHEDDVADKFYIVVVGTIEIWKNFGREGEVRLALEGPGSTFGEMALVDDLGRSATVRTHEPSTFLTIQRQDFEEIMRERTGVLFSILRSLSAMVRESNELVIRNLVMKNEQLSKAYRDLEAAQTQLVNSERISTLGRFASLIIHDLRNPLSAIKGYADVIRFQADEEIASWAKRIVMEADALNRYASELLDYSRGQIRLNLGACTMAGIIQRLRAYAEPNFVSKGMTLETSSTVQNSFVADEERLLRAFINVVDNARKASAANGVVSLSATEVDSLLVVHVVDHGEGMSAEVLSQLFQPFFSQSKQGGTGLGMLVVKNVVEAHSGSIDVRSEVKKGTTVEIRIPLRTSIATA